MNAADYYPAGAYYDSNAPYNQAEVPERDFDVFISQTLSRETTVSTNKYTPEYDEENGWVIYDGRIDDDEYKSLYRTNCQGYRIDELTNYWPYYYVYTKVQEDNLEEIKRLNEIKAECNLIIDHLGELRNMVNDENFRGILHYTANKCRSKINDANEQLKKYI